MKEKIIIFGTSEFSEYVYLTIKKEDQIEVVGFTVDKLHFEKTEFNGERVYVFEELCDYFDMQKCGVLLTVGYTRMNEIRGDIYRRCKQSGYRIASYISNRSICDSVLLDEGCVIMPMSYIPPATSIGICNVVNVGTIIGHTSKIGDFNWFSGNVTMGGNVIVGNNCFIGMNCLLKNGVKVASQTMIGAYSYLSEDTMEGRFYSGNPAINTKKLKSKLVCDFI